MTIMTSVVIIVIVVAASTDHYDYVVEKDVEHDEDYHADNNATTSYLTQVSLTGVSLMSMQLEWIPPRGLVKGRIHRTHSDSLLGVGPIRLLFDWIREIKLEVRKCISILQPPKAMSVQWLQSCCCFRGA